MILTLRRFLVETFGYDSMGNITSIAGDENLEIKYNFLNLPKEIKKSGEVVSKYTYLSDGRKVSSCDATGNGYMYLGTARFALENDVPTFESIPFSGGRIVKTTNGYEPQYYITDHLGSTRMIINKDGQTVDAKFDYTPFGVQITEASLPTNSTEYRFSGKELQNIPDSEIYDFGARQYFPKYAIWGSVDPLAGSFANVSPFAYCSNNPVLFVDPNGMAWYSYWEEVVECDDNGNEVRKRKKRYYYSEKELTKRQMQEGGYTYLGDTYITDDTYYSLNGGEVKYDSNDPISVLTVSQVMNNDYKLIGAKATLKFLYNNIDVISNIVGLFDALRKLEEIPQSAIKIGKLNGATVIGTLNALKQLVDFVQNNDRSYLDYCDVVVGAGAALGGLYGFAVSSLYAGAKINATILTDFEYAARNKYDSVQNYYIGLMSGY